MMMMDVDIIFVDSNIFVYALDERSPWHRSASTFLLNARIAGIDLVVSPQILREYLSVTTRKVILNREGSIERIFDNFLELLTELRIVEENRTVISHLKNLIQEIPIAGKQIHDANIVATMLTHRISHLLTHNVRDFSRFSHLITVIPLESNQKL